MAAITGKEISVSLAPSPSVSGLRGSVRFNASRRSGTPSLSSSVSALSPMPSASLSADSVGSSGNRSLISSTLSPSSLVSRLLPMPSPSVSTDSVGSSGRASRMSGIPSLSSSGSASFGMPSPSVSGEKLSGLESIESIAPSPSVSAFNGLVSIPRLYIPSMPTSLASDRPSLSSSESRLLPTPSPSVSVVSSGFCGKASKKSNTPSLSESIDLDEKS